MRDQPVLATPTAMADAINGSAVNRDIMGRSRLMPAMAKRMKIDRHIYEILAFPVIVNAPWTDQSRLAKRNAAIITPAIRVKMVIRGRGR